MRLNTKLQTMLVVAIMTITGFVTIACTISGVPHKYYIKDRENGHQSIREIPHDPSICSLPMDHTDCFINTVQVDCSQW